MSSVDTAFPIPELAPVTSTLSGSPSGFMPRSGGDMVPSAACLTVATTSTAIVNAVFGFTMLSMHTMAEKTAKATTKTSGSTYALSVGEKYNQSTDRNQARPRSGEGANNRKIDLGILPQVGPLSLTSFEFASEFELRGIVAGTQPPRSSEPDLRSKFRF